MASGRLAGRRHSNGSDFWQCKNEQNMFVEGLIIAFKTRELYLDSYSEEGLDFIEVGPGPRWMWICLQLNPFLSGSWTMYLNKLENISYSTVLQKSETNSLGNSPAQSWILWEILEWKCVSTLLYFVVFAPVFIILWHLVSIALRKRESRLSAKTKWVTQSLTNWEILWSRAE